MRKGDKRKQVPPEVAGACKVVIIAGFLGSGKTTLLKRLLDWETGRGMRPHVIMSEFGDLDIDGVLISDLKIGLTAITGGCACCDLRAELVRRQMEKADVIVINKCDRLSPLEIQNVVNDIGEVNPAAELETTFQCRVDVERILTGQSNIK